MFAFYEATQSMVASAAAMLQPKLSGVFCLASTTVLSISETSPIYSKGLNLALCVKHVVVWSSVLDYTYQIDFFPFGILPAAWSCVHVMLCVEMKRQALEKARKWIDQVEKERKRLDGLMQAVPDGIAVVSGEGSIITYNSMFVQQLALRDSEDLHSALSGLVYADKYSKKHSGALITDVVEFTQREVGEVVNFPPVVLDNSRYLECRGSVMQWDERKVCVLTVRDTTKWIQLEAHAQHENESKTALLRSVSHELRTPTNAILNLAIDLKASEAFTAQGKADLSMVVSATSFLLSLINDLLDLSRISYGAFTLMKEPFSLKGTLQECLQLIEPQCRAKNIQQCLRVDPLLPEAVHTDQNRLRQIVLNLLSNALK